MLLVDDEPDAVHLMERILTSIPRSYRILRAYDGLQAWEIIQDALPDIVFMDLLMPKLDGHQVLQLMHADERTREIPVVIVSARDWIEDEAVLGTPLTVWSRWPIGLARGGRCIQALLDHLTPQPRPLPAPAAPPRPAPLG